MGHSLPQVLHRRSEKAGRVIFLSEVFYPEKSPAASGALIFSQELRSLSARRDFANALEIGVDIFHDFCVTDAFHPVLTGHAPAFPATADVASK
jgi:hypothetical protein